MTARLNGKTLPDGWYWAYLPHLGELNRGKSKHRPRNDERLFGGPYPFIQTSDIRHANGILSTYSQTYSEFGLKQSRLWPAGTLCITIAANIAETAILGFDACFPDSIVGFIPSGEECNVKFVEYFFRTVQQDLEKIAPATAQKNINLEVLSELAVPLPPPNEQHRIVAAIETQFTRLDAAVTALKRSQANLKRYRAAVLKAACEGRLVPTEAELAQAEGRSYEPAAVLLERILAERRRKWEAENSKKKYQEPVAPDTSELPELPEGWCWATVEQLGRLGEQTVLTGPFGSNLGRDDFTTSGTPVLTIGCLTEQGLSADKFAFISEQKAQELNRYRVREGDLLFSRMATVGRAGIVTLQFTNAIFNYHLMRLRLTNSVIRPDYFLAYVRGSRVVTAYVKNVNHGATRDGINTEQLLALPVALPPLAEQQRIVAEVERRLSLIDQLEKTIETDLARANRLRQSILKRAFAGQLVPQDPNDEPASVLLERMKVAKHGKSVQVKLSL